MAAAARWIVERFNLSRHQALRNLPSIEKTGVFQLPIKLDGDQ